jgi:hypothetical protein
VQSQDRVEPAGPDVITTVGPEDSSAGVEGVDRAAVSQDFAHPVKGEDAIVSAGDIEEVAVWIDAQSPWVRNAAVVTEGSQRTAVQVEPKNGSVAAAIRALCAGNEEPFRDLSIHCLRCIDEDNIDPISAKPQSRVHEAVQSDGLTWRR